MKITVRIWIVIIFLIAALIAINPLGYLKEGVIVKTVEINSPSALEGLSKGEIIQSINSNGIKNLQDYRLITGDLFKDIRPLEWDVETDEGTFEYTSLSLGFEVNESLSILSVSGEALLANLSDGVTLLSVNGEKIGDQTQFYVFKNKEEPKLKLNIKTNKNNYAVLTNSLDFIIGPVPKTNLKAGLDLSGGARALVKPEGNLSSEDLDSLVAITQERLNVFGISDVVVRSARDSPFPDANTFMVVEVAGATPSELEQIIGQQGKFEAKIGNDTVFVGGKEDITSVCRNDATCSGIRSCSPSSQGHACTFDFVIYLSPAAAERQAEITATLDENATANGRVLSKPLDLYLDDNLVDSLQISSNLKGKAATQISITGPGFGATQEEAIKAAQENMVQLQTVLVTGSLPVKLIIVKLDSISPLLGKEFIRSILYAGLASIIAVALVLFLRYRDFKLVAPIMFTLISEVTIVLGTAALIKWNLDLASIAGIIAAIGTGVDDQIVIIDESRKSKTHSYSMKERMKRAFFIIFGAFAATFVAMLPLWWAGAGLLRGFAVTTILGIIIGVFITRPAFADFISQTAEE